MCTGQHGALLPILEMGLSNYLVRSLRFPTLEMGLSPPGAQP